MCWAHNCYYVGYGLHKRIWYPCARAKRWLPRLGRYVPLKGAYGRTHQPWYTLYQRVKLQHTYHCALKPQCRQAPCVLAARALLGHAPTHAYHRMYGVYACWRVPRKGSKRLAALVRTTGARVTLTRRHTGATLLVARWYTSAKRAPRAPRALFNNV
jgi:hypothetical protein